MGVGGGGGFAVSRLCAGLDAGIRAGGALGSAFGGAGDGAVARQCGWFWPHRHGGGHRGGDDGAHDRAELPRGGGAHGAGAAVHGAGQPRARDCLVCGVPAHPVPRGVCGDEGVPVALQPRAGGGGRGARYHGHGHLPVLDPRHGVHPRGEADGQGRPVPRFPARDRPEDRRAALALGRRARLHRLHARPRLDTAPHHHIPPATPPHDRPEQYLASSGRLRKM